ncbi:hypothetical protein BASA83_006629 [Batrachochytrium salamandrivorans]|nr:hypothetical protein BASA83_006629 [Batrachochytrium salamandrivorans]
MVSHPSQSLDYHKTRTPSEGMYADDVAVFADSEQPLLAASTAVEQWANWWEMQFVGRRVELYKYLGVLIDSKLDHPAWLKQQKRSALEHAILALHPVLANHQLTVNYRSRVFSAVVMGKAYYGLERGWWQQVTPCTTADDNQQGHPTVHWCRLSTAIGPLLVETGIGSLLTCSLVSRTMTFYTECPRAVGKIPALVLVSSDQTAIQEQILADTTGQAKDSQATTLVCIDGDCEQVETLHRSKTGHRIQSGLVPAIQKSRLRLLGRALDPGVENVYTWLRGGVLNGLKQIWTSCWLDGTVEHESMGTRHDNRALAARLADFLQVALLGSINPHCGNTTGIALWKLAN